MNHTVETVAREKKPYSIPTFTVRPLGDFGALAWNRNGEVGFLDAGFLDDDRSRETQVRTLVVNGFEEDMAEAIRVLSSIGWTSCTIPEHGADSVETLQERAKVCATDGSCILLADMRRTTFATLRPVTRIELDASPRATLILVLSGCGDGASVTAGVRGCDRWRASGHITSDGLGLLVRSLLRISTRYTERRRSQHA